MAESQNKTLVNRVVLRTVTLAFLAGCYSVQQTPVEIRVSVVDHESHPLEGVFVKINDSEVGKTNKAGILSFKTIVPLKKFVIVEAQKQDPKNYYDRSREQIFVDENTAKTLHVKMQMFTAPKLAKPEPNSLATQNDQASNGAEKIEPATSKPMTPNETPLASVELVEINPLLNSSSQPLAQQLESITVHVYNGERSVPGAQVMYGWPESNRLDIGCMTNDRGRCVLRIPKLRHRRLGFGVRKTGMRSIFETREIDVKGLVRFDMQLGTTLDVYASTQDFFRERGIPNMPISMGPTKIGKTNDFGFFPFPIDGEHSTSEETITLDHEDFYPRNAQLQISQLNSDMAHVFFARTQFTRPVIALDRVDVDKRTVQGESAVREEVLKALSSNKKFIGALDVYQDQTIASGLPARADATLDVKQYREEQNSWVELRVWGRNKKLLTSSLSQITPGDNGFSTAIGLAGERLVQAFPFHTRVVSAENQTISLSAPSIDNDSLAKVGEMLQLYPFSLKVTPGKISEPRHRFIVKEVWQNLIRVVPANAQNKLVAVPGDRAVFIRKQIEASSTRMVKGKIKLDDSLSPHDIDFDQALVYLDNELAAIGHRDGAFAIDEKRLAQSHTLVVVHPDCEFKRLLDAKKDPAALLQLTLSVAAPSFIRAQELISRGEVERALNILAKIMEGDPYYEQARVELGNVLLKMAAADENRPQGQKRQLLEDAISSFEAARKLIGTSSNVVQRSTKLKNVNTQQAVAITKLWDLTKDLDLILKLSPSWRASLENIKSPEELKTKIAQLAAEVQE